MSKLVFKEEENKGAKVVNYVDYCRAYLQNQDSNLASSTRGEEKEVLLFCDLFKEGEGQPLDLEKNQGNIDKNDLSFPAEKSDPKEIKERSEKIIAEAEDKKEKIEEGAYRKGYKLGRERGYKDGREEVLRLISRLDQVVSTAIDIKDDLIKSSEKTMLDLILMISKKIIKDEIKERKGIVLNNIKAALEKIKDEEKVTIRVNISDLQMTAKHKNDFLKLFESYKKITVIEDSRVDEGGCIVESDFSSLDARISTQFDAIEESIKRTSLL